MKPAPFTYHNPTTVSEAIALLGRHQNTRVLAGGQSLMPMMNFRLAMPDHIVDLNDVEGLAGIELRENALYIGAMTRQREIEFSPLVETHCPLLSEAIRNVGHRQTRNRGTFGGSLCHLDPSAELPAVAMTLEGTVWVQSAKGERKIAMADFPAGFMTPAIEAGEIVTGVLLPLWKKGHGYAFLEFARRHGDFALVGVAVLMTLDAQGCIEQTAITLCGVGPGPIRMVEAEKALLGATSGAEAFSQAARLAGKVDAIQDVHATKSYRQHLAATLTERALALAFSRVSPS